MSELKSVDQSDVMWGHWFTEYYLKSEADRYIRHQKRKRCLAMADMCGEALCYLDNVKYTHFKGEAYCWRQIKHYGKWGQTWLIIAEKFKDEYK